jgi:DNA-binding response OmpR family regulator
MSTILIVEDNIPLSNVYRQVLEQTGFTVVQAASCQQTFARLEEIVPDVIFLDLALPDGDGLAIADYVRHDLRFQMTQIAVITGHQYVEGDLGISLVLHKPVSTLALLDAVKWLTTPAQVR